MTQKYVSVRHQRPTLFPDLRSRQSHFGGDVDVRRESGVNRLDVVGRNGRGGPAVSLAQQDQRGAEVLQGMQWEFQSREHLLHKGKYQCTYG